MVWVGRGRARKTIDRFFTEALSPYQRSKIEWACCDMSEAYIGAGATGKISLNYLARNACEW